MKPAPGSAVGWQLLALIGTGRCASNHYIAEEARPLPSIDAKNSRGFHYLQLRTESSLALKVV